MKRLFLLLTSLALFSQENQEASGSFWDYHPLHIGTNGIALSGASVTPRRSSEEGDLYFRKANAYITMLTPLSRTTYLFPRLEWNIFTMKWKENPRFHETRFSYLQFALMLYSIGLEKWRWIFRIDYNLDVKHLSKPGPYGLFGGLLWGMYELHPKWHYHIGAAAYKGLKGSQVYPLIGLDFSPNKTWKFQAIFPIDYSIQYAVTSWCRLSLKGRPLKERFRTGSHEPERRAIFNYSTMGAEFNVHFEKPRQLELELYGGYNFGGSFYIKHQRGRAAYYTDLSGAWYAGGNLDYGF